MSIEPLERTSDYEQYEYLRVYMPWPSRRQGRSRVDRWMR